SPPSRGGACKSRRRCLLKRRARDDPFVPLTEFRALRTPIVRVAKIDVLHSDTQYEIGQRKTAAHEIGAASESPFRNCGCATNPVLLAFNFLVHALVVRPPRLEYACDRGIEDPVPERLPPLRLPVTGRVPRRQCFTIDVVEIM